ncbi:MAG TPA: class I SAM-dependent methyltransferase [Candidatus Polarisedimenticolia bacterium]|nr:class I SAM-dependent methyltransferase [Candidatus Polarisedimenticolia bacterium]
MERLHRREGRSLIHPKVNRTVADVRDHYDELARAYGEIWGEHVHHGYWITGSESQPRAVEQLVDLVIERLDLQPGCSMADIGCGTGAPAAYILSSHDARITGFTVSSAQASIAARRQPTYGTLLCHERDWVRNGLPDDYFDRSYAIESSEHFADKPAFFAEAWRTLRPGGRLVVCAWLAAQAPSAWSVRHLLEPICREGALPSLASRSEYAAMARDAGFELVAFDDISDNVRRTWAICCRRLAARLVTSHYYRGLLASQTTRNRSFALSLPRLWLALKTGAIVYGIFVWRKPKKNPAV